MSRGLLQRVSVQAWTLSQSHVRTEEWRCTDVLGVMMWCKYFMGAQGYTINKNLLYQDNKSTELLAKNGRMSAG